MRSSNPFLVMTLLVRDEQDIIQSTIDFHLSQGIDFIIATDNRSVDATPDILKKYEADGVLRYIHEPGDDYSQGRWVTRMARLAYAEHAATWVIHSDADEFWWPKHGDLARTFSQLPPGTNIVKAPRTNFVFLGADPDGRPFYEAMIYREKASCNAAGRPIAPKIAHLAVAGTTVGQGNHAVEGIPAPRVAGDVIDIMHFPVRSCPQFQNKIAKGGSAYERNTEIPTTSGRAWRRLYNEYRETGSLERYCREITFDGERIARGLQSGTLVKDTRLRDYLQRIGNA